MIDCVPLLLDREMQIDNKTGITSANWIHFQWKFIKNIWNIIWTFHSFFYAFGWDLVM